MNGSIAAVLMVALLAGAAHGADNALPILTPEQSTIADAADAPAGPEPLAPDDAPTQSAVLTPALFPKGTWTFELGGGYVQPIRFSNDKLYNLNAGVGYYFLNNLSITGQLEGYFADQPSHDALLGGAGLILRWHFFTAGGFSLYADGGGSVTMAEEPVPEFGTHFNFTGKGGLGGTLRLRDNVHLEAGARYFHLSNGNLHGRDQNPSYDGAQYYTGLVFTF